jgi:N-glycosylase/DNA lyase
MIDFEEFWSLLSDYFDEELDRDICEEIDEFMGEDIFCENLFNTFRRTVDMCREIEMIDVPEEVHRELYTFLKIQIEIEQEED